MEAIDVYLMYCAFKAHFTRDDYDYFKYDGKTRIKRESFYKRKDRLFFVKISRRYKEYDEVKNYLVSNFVKRPDGYVANFDDKIYQDWLDRRRNFYNIFSNEMQPYVKNFEPLFAVENSNHPKLLREYLGKRISLETLAVLDNLVNFSEKWDKEMSGDYVWNDVKKLLNNYQRFLTIDVKRYRILLLKLIEESS